MHLSQPQYKKSVSDDAVMVMDILHMHFFSFCASLLEMPMCTFGDTPRCPAESVSSTPGWR